MSDRLSPGAITVRSNVVLEPDRWDLVPGELLPASRRSVKPTRLQHRERMYYEPCAICRRPIVEINLRGCTQCPYAPSRAEVADAHARHQQTIADATTRETAENAELSSGDPVESLQADISEAAA